MTGPFQSHHQCNGQRNGKDHHAFQGEIGQVFKYGHEFRPDIWRKGLVDREDVAQSWRSSKSPAG